MTLKIGIVGATGNVGREMLSILAEKGFKSENIFPIAASRSEGMKVSNGESEIDVTSLEKNSLFALEEMIHDDAKYL